LCAEDIAANNYELSLNRYKRVEHDEADHEPPAKIIAELKALELEIDEGLRKLVELVT
jgi:type I restriction enzyme M protein